MTLISSIITTTSMAELTMSTIGICITEFALMWTEIDAYMDLRLLYPLVYYAKLFTFVLFSFTKKFKKKNKKILQ